MKSLPDLKERRLAELDELFGPERAAYGESYRERLREDEEVSARVRERFERGEALGKYPALSNYLSNLSAKEKEMFFKTESGVQFLGPHSIVPEDVGVRFRQLRRLLSMDPEFITRYPEAHSILLSHRARMREPGGLPLPSFGIHILRHQPRPYISLPEETGVGDAYTATYAPKPEIAHPPADQSFWPVNKGFLRGVLLAILSREEYLERIVPYAEDPGLFEGVEVPQKCAVRITDLRFAAAFELEESERFLLAALRSLQTPITAEGVVEWKHRIIGNEAESEPDPVWKEFADRLVKLTDKALPSTQYTEAYDALMKEMQEYQEAHEPERPKAKLTNEELERRRIEIATVSFAAAALFLFIDLGMPGVRDEKPYQLAEQIRELARIIQRLMTDLVAREQELNKLLSNRAAGRQPRPESHYYFALRYWRYGRSEEDIARWLGITPYSSKTVEGSRAWRSRLRGMLVRGQEVENERYPRAAAIFAHYRHSPHIRRKAHRAYRAYLVQTKRMPGYPPLWEVGRKIRVNHQTRRGLEIIEAYILLGSCLVRGQPTAP
jgi:hypothetical protein